MPDRSVHRRSSMYRGSRAVIVLGAVLFAAATVGSRTRAQENPIHESGEQDGHAAHLYEHSWPMIGHDPANARDQPFASIR